MTTEVQLSGDEILERFAAFDFEPTGDDFKAEMMCRVNASLQAMYSIMYQPTQLVIGDTHGDYWQEEHNRVVSLYQRYLNTIPVS